LKRTDQTGETKYKKVKILEPQRKIGPHGEVRVIRGKSEFGFLKIPETRVKRIEQGKNIGLGGSEMPQQTQRRCWLRSPSDERKERSNNTS